nr:uncharacterized protein LOC131799865 [Pocillopora verrucosa]
MARSLRRGHLVDDKALNTLSTVDFEAHFKAKKYKNRSKFYLVERLIGQRRSKNEDFDYLVKWKNWPPRTSTREPSAHLSGQLIRYEIKFVFGKSPVSVERVQSVSTSFLQGILSILRSNAIKVNYSSELRVDHDIVRYVIRRKDKKAHDGVSILYEKDDFSRLELPQYWWYYLNELREGIAVDFPIKLKTVLTYLKHRHAMHARVTFSDGWINRNIAKSMSNSQSG